MAKVLCDYHMHTYLCKHAEGMPVDYLKTAVKKGLKSIGFSDHCPVPVGYDQENRMYLSEFDKYREIIGNIREISEIINILFGMEIDYVPGRMKELEEFISKNKCDYIIGSIHYVDGLPFDHPDYVESWNDDAGIERVWHRYFELMLEYVNWGKFDIIGHIDLPKKFSLKPKCQKKIYEIMNVIFKAASEKGIMLELNTSGLRKQAKEIYPSKEILSIAFDNKVNIVFGSDAHRPEEVGCDFDIAAEIAQIAGYKYYNILKSDKVTEFVKF